VILEEIQIVPSDTADKKNIPSQVLPQFKVIGTVHVASRGSWAAQGRSLGKKDLAVVLSYDHISREHTATVR
jgi:hypothetical protein